MAICKLFSNVETPKKQRLIEGSRADATASGAARFSAMTRATLLTAMLAGAWASLAEAQTPDLDAARIGALEQQWIEARQQGLEREREAYAARDRLQTELMLSRMASARDAAAPPPADPFVAPPSQQASDAAFSALVAQQAADADRILQLQREALARSNARVLAVQPAL